MATLQSSSTKQTFDMDTSIFLSMILNLFGFSERRIAERRKLVNTQSAAFDIQVKQVTKQADYEKKIIGSRREGTELTVKSDLDTMQIDHGLVCTEMLIPIEGKVTFHMETNGAPSGYCFLRLINTAGNNSAYQRVKQSLERKLHGTYLSSQIYSSNYDDIWLYGNGFLSHNVKYFPKQGPSIPREQSSLMIGFLEMIAKYDQQIDTCVSWMKESLKTDCVYALPCNQTSHLNSWATRSRTSDWPDEETIAHVLKTPVHVVPVGWKGSPDKDLQWRISFVDAEMSLVESFNEIQMKVFILGKAIAKNELRPICKQFKSYMVKMAMFWLCEKFLKNDFQEHHLIARLINLLEFLKQSIESQKLPHFFIPERNLFEIQIDTIQQKQLIDKLDLLSAYFNEYHIDLTKTQEKKSLENMANVVFFGFMDKINTAMLNQFSAEEIAQSFLMAFQCGNKWSYYLQQGKFWSALIIKLLYYHRRDMVICLVTGDYFTAKLQESMISDASIPVSNGPKQLMAAPVTNKESNTELLRTNQNGYPEEVIAQVRQQNIPQSQQMENQAIDILYAVKPYYACLQYIAREMHSCTIMLLLFFKISLLSMPLMSTDDYMTIFFQYIYIFVFLLLTGKNQTVTLCCLSAAWIACNVWDNNFYNIMLMVHHFLTEERLHVTCGNETVFPLSPHIKSLHEHMHILSNDLYVIILPLTWSDLEQCMKESILNHKH